MKITKCVFAVRDSRLGTYAPPCLFDNEAVSVRAFGDMVRGDKNSLIAMHPEDFSLVYLGSFDVETGIFDQSVDKIRVLCSAADFLVADKTDKEITHE